MKQFIRISKIVFLSFIILAGIIAPLPILSYYNNSVNKIEVAGTVFAKGTEDHVHKHTSNTHWVICVKPDNPSYEMFDVDLSFAQYCKYNVRDKCSFTINKNKVGLEKTDIFNTLQLVWLLLVATAALSLIFYTFGRL